MKIHVEYFALLRECAGRTKEDVETQADSVLQLFEELQQHYHFPLAPAQLGVAVNDQFSSFDARLNPGDHIVFIPPIAGG